jgi:hypothetical protein
MRDVNNFLDNIVVFPGKERELWSQPTDLAGGVLQAPAARRDVLMVKGIAARF